MPLVPADRNDRINTGNTHSALVEMWRNNLRKSQGGAAQSSRLLDDPRTINLIFDGGGLAIPASGQSGLIEISFPCRILGCHIFVGNADLQPTLGTAVFSLNLSQFGFWAEGSSPLWQDGIQPSITTAAEADVPVDGWNVQLEPGDLLAYKLESFTSTDARFVVLSLPIRRLELAQTTTAILSDSYGDQITTDSGEEVAIRG